MDDVELAVRVIPGARRSRLVGRYGDRLEVQVAAAPERGKANRALCDLLAQAFDVAPSDVQIVRGDTSPDKRVRIRGIGVAAMARLADLLGVDPPQAIEAAPRGRHRRT